MRRIVDVGDILFGILSWGSFFFFTHWLWGRVLLDELVLMLVVGLEGVYIYIYIDRSWFSVSSSTWIRGVSLFCAI